MVLTYWSIGSSHQLRRQRGAPNRSKGEEACQRGKPKNERRLAPGEIRSGAEKLIHGLIAHIVRIAFDAISYAPHQAGELGSISVQVVCRTFRGASKVANHLRASCQLTVQQLLHLIGDRG